ncbi:MAG: beta-lactamase family protein [Chloroflexi bacterium]|nr:beta-lactamase family protein [Chloroflexota bacterium]MCC6894605.1 beta-lactamase family protein [Anaerolineae bacterium]
MTQLTDKVDALFSMWDTAGTPGCVVAVIQDGAMSYQRSYGMADLERQVSLSSQSVFDLASVGKQFTAMLIALLAQEGRLSLEDDVRRYIPELPDYGHRITIRHLIYHTSGLLDYTTLMELTMKPFENRYFEGELLSLITRQKTLNFPPGTKYLYCNSGYFLLGVIAQRVQDQPFTALLRQYILEPLGMRRTDFNDDLRRVIPNRAIGYSPAEIDGFNTEISFCGGFGDGPLLSTVEDLYRWDQNFYANRLGDGTQTLIEQAVTSGTLNNGASIGYGFGLALGQHRGLPTVSHSGGWAGYVSQITRFPEQRFTVIILSNLNSIRPSVLATQVAEIYLADLFPEAAPDNRPVTAGDTLQVDRSSVAGFYRSAEQGDILELTADLQLTFYGMTRQLVALSATHFVDAERPFPLEVTRSESGDLSFIFRGEPDTYKKMAIQPIDDFQSYAGEYYAGSLGIAYSLTINDQHVFMKRGYAPQEALRPVTQDVFTFEHLILEFRRDAHNQITGFDLRAGRVEQIQFLRQG